MSLDGITAPVDMRWQRPAVEAFGSFSFVPYDMLPYVSEYKSRIFGVFYKVKVGGVDLYINLPPSEKKLHHKYPYYKL